MKERDLFFGIFGVAELLAKLGKQTADWCEVEWGEGRAGGHCGQGEEENI